MFGVLVSLIWSGSMLNNFAPLYVKPKHFNIGFSGTLRSLFVILLREYFFSLILVHFLWMFVKWQHLEKKTYCEAGSFFLLDMWIPYYLKNVKKCFFEPGTIGKFVGGTIFRIRCSGTNPSCPPALELLGDVGDIDGVLEFDEADTQPGEAEELFKPRPEPGRLDLSQALYCCSPPRPEPGLE